MTALKETEALISHAIREYLEYKNVFFWRNNVGAGFFKNKNGGERFVRFSQKGSPDFFCLSNGMLFGIEIKTAKGEQSEDQEKYQKAFEKAGGVYILARCVDDVSKYI